MSLELRNVTWEKLKARIEKKQLRYQYSENTNEYHVFVMDGGLEWSARILKETPAATDFAENYLPSANRRSRTDVTTDAKKTAFGHQIGVQKFNHINLKSTFGLSILRDAVDLTGSATAGEVNGEIRLATGTTSSSKSSVRTRERMDYVAGFEIESGTFIRIPTPPVSGQVARWGMFDDLNGWGWGVDSTGIFIFVRKDGVDDKVYQNGDPGFNIDKLDGNGASGANLDLARGNIFETNAVWYGAGPISFNLFNDEIGVEGNVVTAHRFKRTGTIVTDPNQPVKIEVENGESGAEFEVFVGGRQASLMGIAQREVRVTSDIRGPLTLTDNNRTPVMALRKKATFNGRPNTIKCDIKNLQVVTNDAAEIEIWRGVTSLTDASWRAPTNIPPEETAIEVDTSAISFTGGIPRFKKLASSSSSGQNKRGRLDERDIDGMVFHEDEILLITARRIFNNNTQITTLIDVGEQW